MFKSALRFIFHIDSICYGQNIGQGSSNVIKSANAKIIYVIEPLYKA